MEKQTVFLWLWEQAPEKYRQLSTNGGDEDYVILCTEERPDDKYLSVTPWDQAARLADWLYVCGFSRHEHEDGTVWITCHS